MARSTLCRSKEHIPRQQLAPLQLRYIFVVRHLVVVHVHNIHLGWLLLWAQFHAVDGWWLIDNGYLDVPRISCAKSSDLHRDAA